MAKEKDTSHCTQCNAQCCRHVALSIDRPTTKRDYDHVRWYLFHDKVTVFIDHEDNWFIQFAADCEHILPDNRCGIYATRPRICKDYPGRDELCEGETEEPAFTEKFTEAAEFEEWLTKKSIAWKWKS